MRRTQSQVAAQQTTVTGSPFLSLPAELRNMIYPYLVHCNCISQQKNPLHDHPIPSVLLVNHQVCDEALAVFYVQPLILTHIPPKRDRKPISTNILQKAQHVTLSLEPEYVIWTMDADCTAMTRLVNRCCDAWGKDRHSLKTLTVKLDGSAWEVILRKGLSRYMLGFQIEKFLALLRKRLGRLRGVGKVVLTGMAGKVLGEYRELVEAPA